MKSTGAPCDSYKLTHQPSKQLCQVLVEILDKFGRSQVFDAATRQVDARSCVLFEIPVAATPGTFVHPVHDQRLVYKNNFFKQAHLNQMQVLRMQRYFSATQILEAARLRQILAIKCPHCSDGVE